MPEIPNGESVTVTGSKGDVYTLSRKFGVYSCTCPAFKHAKGAERGTCKHLKNYLADKGDATGNVGSSSAGTAQSQSVSSAAQGVSSAASALRPAPPKDTYADVEVKPRKRGIFREDHLDRAEKHLNDKKYDAAEEALDIVGQQVNTGSIFVDTESQQFQKDWQRWYDLRSRLIRERRQAMEAADRQRKELNEKAEAARREQNQQPAKPATAHLRVVRPDEVLEEEDVPDEHASDIRAEQDDYDNRDLDQRDFEKTDSGDDDDDRRASELGIKPSQLTEKEWNSWFNTLPTVEQALFDYLSKDPEFLNLTIWQLFESPAGRTVFGPRWHWTVSYRSFNVVVLRLVEEKKIDRAKILAYSVSAVVSKPETYSKEWFANLYAKLKPTLDERKSYLDVFYKAVGVPNSAAINWGLEQISELHKKGCIDSEATLKAVCKFRRVSDAIFKSVIGVIKQVAAKDKKARAAATRLAADLLIPQMSLTQHKAALDVVEKFGDADDPEFVKLICHRCDNLRGVQLLRAQTWLSKAMQSSQEPGEEKLDQSTNQTISELLNDVRDFDAKILQAVRMDEAASAARGEAEIPPALDFESGAIPVLSPRRVLERIDNINDLIYGFMRIIDRKATGDEIEQVVDALSRLNNDRPMDFAMRTKSLKERAIQRLQPEQIQDQPQLRNAEPFGGVSDQEDLAALALAWTDGAHLSEYYKICPRLKKLESLHPEAGRNTVAGITINSFFAARMCALAMQVLRKMAFPSLAAPTHKGGWIDPHVIGDRLREWAKGSEEPNRYDVTQALLRLAPQFRKEALASLEGIDGEIAAAFRYALGADLPLNTTKDWLWGTAARARNAREDDLVLADRFPHMPPNTVKRAVYQYKHEDVKFGAPFLGDITGSFLRPFGYKMPSDAEIGLPTFLFHCKPYGMDFEMQYFNKRPWEALVWPQSYEAYFAGEARQVRQYLNSQGRYWLSGWDPIFDPGVYANGMARFVIALGLSAKHEACTRQSVEALNTVIDDCRMDGEAFGEALAIVLQETNVVLGRWFHAFEEVVKVSALHKLVIKRALEGLVTTLHPMKQVPQKILPMLYSLSFECCEGIQNDRARTILELLAAKGNKQAKSLIEVKTNAASPVKLEAAQHSLERRVTRAKRWQSMCEASSVVLQ